jgi:hypothetical protein
VAPTLQDILAKRGGVVTQGFFTVRQSGGRGRIGFDALSGLTALLLMRHMSYMS